MSNSYLTLPITSVNHDLTQQRPIAYMTTEINTARRDSLFIVLWNLKDPPKHSTNRLLFRFAMIALVFFSSSKCVKSKPVFLPRYFHEDPTSGSIPSTQLMFTSPSAYPTFDLHFHRFSPVEHTSKSLYPSYVNITQIGISWSTINLQA